MEKNPSTTRSSRRSNSSKSPRYPPRLHGKGFRPALSIPGHPPAPASGRPSAPHGRAVGGSWVPGGGNFGSKYPEMSAFDATLVSDSAGSCGWPGWRAGPTTLAARFVFTQVAQGEWRNGRRAGFRCQWAQARGGSTPLSPTEGCSAFWAPRVHESPRAGGHAGVERLFGYSGTSWRADRAAERDQRGSEPSDAPGASGP